jgi:acyl dehydratase
MAELYFQDLERLKKEHRLLETPLSQKLPREIVDGYIQLTQDDHRSHADQDYNHNLGYPDIFIPGFLIPALAEGYFKQHYLYALHMNLGFRPKFKKPLFPGDSIKVIDEILEAMDDRRLIIDNASPVKIMRKVINQDSKLVSTITLDYSIRRS